MKSRRGFAFIDALLAVAILALTTLGFLTLLRQTLKSTVDAQDREREVRGAAIVMAKLAIRDDAWLSQHEGTSRENAWELRVQRVAPGVYRAEVRDTLHGHLWLETAIYHAPADSNATR